ncbi:glycosyltransferase family 2 protein [Fimbriiglobus ruber]|uniref:Glycosyl transferase, group 2 family protein n=1 Tax=Fimbriiglobus ruber TaxID=1908690 RepID=A0A225DG83_9BACT|nr:glycosyltransferase family 2 protein [Fimbriiglobus ruber]OWK36179.1 Glycosyl transferase, group 2 family protein [Fimbriiglobus ruber]
MDANPLTARPHASSLSLVVPAYNEAAVIAHAVREADEALGELFDEYEILVVDDGSGDDTAAIVAALLGEFPRVRLLWHPRNRGYGAALRTGFEAAAFERVAFTDADGQFDLRDLSTLAALVDNTDIAVGYRADRKDPWRRRVLSRGYNLLARTLLGTRIRDVDCALKVFRREVVVRLLPAARGFFVNTEMMTRARLLGFDVIERPVTHRPRLGGASKVSLWEVPKTLRVLLGFWWREVVRGIGPTAREPITVVSARVPVGTGMSRASRPRNFKHAAGERIDV